MVPANTRTKIKKSLAVLLLWMLCWTGFQLSALVRSGGSFESRSRPTNQNRCRTNISDPGCKKILLWNNADRIEVAAFGRGYRPFIDHRCAVQDCVLSADRSRIPLESYDAIIIIVQQQPEFPQHQRPAHQRLIFFTQEPPTMLPFDPSRYNGYFNWTMSYRLDSDIRLLYGQVVPRSDSTGVQMRTEFRPTVNYGRNKTRLVAWMVSHCRTFSQRERYVRELRRHVQVDIYGRCGRYKCRRSAKHWLSYPECYDRIEQHYKFYLSFENSICRDYVTEKFFHILEHNVVPIVFGGADYESIAPPHSFIDALKFTPASLAAYLRQLDADDSLYNEYFRWKTFYTVDAGVKQMARRGFCDLCAKLHQDDRPKIHLRLGADWNNETQCRTLQQATQDRWPTT